VALDDNLKYDEPWGWMQPARHALRALLLEQARVMRDRLNLAKACADIPIEASCACRLQHHQ